MKRYFILMLALLTYIGATADVATVGTADDFVKAVKANDDIKLTADIDLTKIDPSSTKDIPMIDITFKGTIDGGVVDGNGVITKVYTLKGSTGNSRAHHPIFKAVEGATFKNLALQNFRIEWNDDNVGAIAMTATKSNFEDLILSDISIFNDEDNAGAVAGSANGCYFKNVKGMGNDITVDGQNAGGLIGKSQECMFFDCLNSAYSTVFADGSWADAYAGGIVGQSLKDEFVGCVNFASVGADDDRVGGIAGYSELSYFTGCNNSGYIVQCKEKNFQEAAKNIKEKINKILTDLDDRYAISDVETMTMGWTLFGSLGVFAALGVTTLVLECAAIVCVAVPVAALVVFAAGLTAVLIEGILFEINAHDELGGICGSCNSSCFDTCANYGNCLCRDSSVGGIVGYVSYSSKDYNQKPFIKNCLNNGRVQGYEEVGGIVGNGYSSCPITNCLTTGQVTASGETLQPLGKTNGATLTNNYYLSSKEDTSAKGVTGVTEQQLASGYVAKLLNGGEGVSASPWRQTLGTDQYPTLDTSHEIVTAEKFAEETANHYYISNYADLEKLREDVNSGTKDVYIVYFGNDIDCSGYTWVPIGTYDHPFTGFCYGNGHTISNLNTAKDTSKNGLGFFGVVGLNTEVRDLFIGSGSITGGHSIGGIIGYAEYKGDTDGFIRVIGCGNAANITGDYDCGGLVGAIYSDPSLKLTIDNCYNMGNVNANSSMQQSAALCGYAKKNALVTSCWNTGSVTGYKSGMGFVRGDADAAPEIHNCYVADGLTYLKQGNGVDGGNGVECFTPEEAKNGTLCLNLNGGSNDSSVGLIWEQDITSDAYPIYKGYLDDGKAIYTSRNVSGKYGTIVLPYTVTSDDNIKYYTLSEVTVENNETKLCFATVKELPAGTPAIFRLAYPGTAESPSSVDFLSSDYTFAYEIHDVETTNGWTMTGNLNSDGSNAEFTNGELTNLYYISGDQIKTATSKLTVSPFRAYLVGPTGSNARALKIAFDDDSDPTGLRLVPEETKGNTTTYGIYNLSGQRLDAPQHGINIVNGKKVLNK